MQTIAWTYHMANATVHCIIIETANVIWNVLSAKYLKPPSTEQEWLDMAQQFDQQWNFTNWVGALDGKHVTIQAAAKSGSKFFNYKKSFSIVLLACCDANHNFTLVDIGSYGSAGDGGVLRRLFLERLDNKIKCIYHHQANYQEPTSI